MVDALAAGDGAAAFATIDRVADAGHDPRRFATDLLERLRDLIVLQRITDATGSGIIDAPADQLDRMTGQAARMGPGALSRMADIVHNGLTEMRGATAPRLLLELITARMLLPGADDSASAMLHRLERMERRLGAGEPEGATPSDPVRSAEPPRPAEPVRAPDPAPAPARGAAKEPPVRSQPPRAEPSPAADAPAGSLDAAGVRRVWDEVLTLVRRHSQRVHAFLRDATVRDVQGDEVVLLFRNSFHASSTSAQPELLVDALHEVLGGVWRVRVELGGDERVHTTPSLQTRTGDDPARGNGGEGVASIGGHGDDWPEIARPGGSAAGVPAPPPAQARASTRGAGPGRPAAKPAKASRPAPARGGRGRDDGPPLDEPPFDPEYDGPSRRSRRPDGGSYGGFDPGDEPLDDGAPAVRESSEAQAIRAVTEVFAVERIGDTPPRS
jgi:DNA polymerase-3 subunit gamma/tau